MSLEEDLTEVKRRLEELARSVIQLERNLTQQREGKPVPMAVGRPDGMVTIPDTPYDSSLWTDSDDEGLGARDRRAP
ncbi:hypothetical protein E2C00_27745 [Streptomyces sp. WAC05374]|uniref:hypothetical protein n=1 Tax=Streptomyces sp. WAC05374 TaxID=2487420 RepID=UPI000F863DB2|nr:hypothetical protein [Streptomyces sp. WAC05374]RST14659.1 hypothetical protein EF905_17030 [Streptomyces sp. WAC05374]TDF43307.1 hypothetical protein E2B92_20600 [Streptomyces sp. WAC05374]TDF51093.1 hypothetical protein E2C00_27745 [Streptomyces sp. WAC05374]TDF52164.1 hypothetical protein E2C02_21420 [Streptomyces sp. WAC05374]